MDEDVFNMQVRKFLRTSASHRNVKLRALCELPSKVEN